MKNTFFILALVLAILAVRGWEQRERVYPPGVLVAEYPLQSAPAQTDPIALGDYVLTPRAGFRLRARVLSREDYRWSDGADLAPVDLALGWGVMSDQAVLDRIDITQGSRWYFTRYEHPAPISDRQIIRHSANMHLIPANDWVADKLDDVRASDLVQLRGMLVDVDRSDGFYWRTSMTREDTGNGSCELFYVEHVHIEPERS
jgi:hypothetical protein